MGQKIHPLGFRIPVTQIHRAVWFAKPRDYGQWVLQDDQIRQYFMQRYPDQAFLRITVARHGYSESRFEHIQKSNPFPYTNTAAIDVAVDKTVPILKFQRPRSILKFISVCGLMPANKKMHKKATPERCRKLVMQLAHQVTMHMDQFRLYVQDPPLEIRHVQARRIAHLHMHPMMIGRKIAQQLEKRQRYRKTIKKVLKDIYQSGLEPYGVKIQVSGRLDGAEMARTEWFVKGRIPLQTLRARIDYRYQTAKTLYGIIGIKVWVYHTANQRDWDERVSPKKQREYITSPRGQARIKTLYERHAIQTRRFIALNEAFFEMQRKAKQQAEAKTKAKEQDAEKSKAEMPKKKKEKARENKNTKERKAETRAATKPL
jgi:small subunit ribosomal protein S3